MLLEPRNAHGLHSPCRTSPCEQPVPSESPELASHGNDVPAAPPHHPSSTNRPPLGKPHGGQGLRATTSASCSARPTEHPRLPNTDSDQSVDHNAKTECPRDCLDKFMLLPLPRQSQRQRLPQNCHTHKQWTPTTL